MMRTAEDISIIIPTIPGREEWLRKCLHGYNGTAEGAEIIVISSAPSCGVAWEMGYEKSTKQYIHFTADDLVPMRGWWQAAVQMIERGFMPAAYVRSRTGGPALCDSPLGLMGLHPNILVPFMTRDMVEQGGWFQPFHYGTDDWITYRAVQLGYEVRRCVEYSLTHWVAPEGRNYLRRYEDVKQLADAMEAAGYLPPVYRQLEINLRESKTGLDGVSITDLANRLDRNQLRRQDEAKHRMEAGLAPSERGRIVI